MLTRYNYVHFVEKNDKGAEVSGVGGGVADEGSFYTKRLLCL